jgi:ribonuclease BN (tRNA processing enzyme)
VLLTVLGCSGSAPGPNAPASGYLIEADGFLLAIELGNGTLAALQATRDLFTLDALLFSHLHPDHCADFSGLTVLRRYHPAPSRDPRLHPLPVYAPVEAPGRFVAAYCPDKADRQREDLADVYTFHELRPETIHIGPFEVAVIRANHPPASFSFRISHGGRSLVYTGDTGMFAGLIDLASGVDVLLSEASWTHGEGRPTGLHLSGREAGEVAKRSGAGRLLVTHVPPWVNPDEVFAEARAEYPGDAVLVAPGATYLI